MLLVHHGLGLGAILYGGNFAVRSEALARIGGFNRRIDSTARTPISGRRLTRSDASGCPSAGSGPRAALSGDGQAGGVRPYVRNFWSEILRHRPADDQPSRREGRDVPGYEPFLLCDFHVHTGGATGRLSLREVVDL